MNAENKKKVLGIIQELQAEYRNAEGDN